MWLFYAVLTIVFYSLFDFFMKKAGGKIDVFLGTLIINLVDILPALLVLGYLWMRKSEMLVTGEGVRNVVVAGLMAGLASIAFLKMFSMGAGLAFGAPIVRIGMVLGTVILGSVLLRETLSLRQVAGLVMGGLGLILVMLK